jgi:hypothetical protein
VLLLCCAVERENGGEREKRKKRGKGTDCSGSRLPSPAPTAGMAASAVNSDEQKREGRKERK